MAAKRILVVTEHFFLGGAETHIAGMVRVLTAQGHSVYLAMGNSADTAHLPPGLAGTLDGLAFQPDTRTDALLQSIRRLGEFIHEHKIHLVHAHPYLSMLPAVLAAQRAGVPAVVTLHGPANLSESYGRLHTLLLKGFILPSAGRVYCVSSEVRTLVRPYAADGRLRILPNAVDLARFQPAQSDQHAERWAVIARLDAFKAVGIQDFCRKALNCGIPEIHIIGDGPARAELEQFAADPDISGRIRLLGEDYDVASTLRNGYRGVAGMGRALLEGLAGDHPTVLVGYDGVKGLLDERLAAEASWSNFSGRGLPTITEKTLNEQLNRRLRERPDDYRLRGWVERHHNEDRVWADYQADVNGLAFERRELANDIEEALRAHVTNETAYLNDPQLYHHLANLLLRHAPQAGACLTLDVLQHCESQEQTLAQIHSSLAASAANARLPVTPESVRQFEDLFRRISEAAQSLQSLNTLCAQKELRAAALQTALEESRERCRRLTEEVEQSRRTLEEQRQTIESFNSTREALDSLRQHAAALEQELARQEQTVAALTQQIAERDGRIAALQAQPPAPASLVHDVRRSAQSVIDTLEQFKLHKGFRAARLMQLVRNQFLHTSNQGRAEFARRVFRRVAGDRQPLSSFSPLDIPIRQLQQLIEILQFAPVSGSAPAAAPLPPEYPPLPELPARPGIVNIFTYLFFDQKGKELMGGGAERYLIELCRIIRELGYTPEVYQCGEWAWVTHYDGVKVSGIDISGDLANFNRRVHEQVAPGSLTIYSAFNVAYPYHHANSLGISHGIFWDHPGFQNPVEMHKIQQAIRNCRYLVSVDTNTINWVRATFKECGDRFTYVPNFVDVEAFQPRAKRPDEPVVILYPRRLYPVRGFWLVAEIIPYILENYPNVEFHFVGKGEDREAQAVKELRDRYGDRIQWYFLEPDDMHQAYHKADIALVPTTASEGTSLSCLEAMACGNAVISTNVGGLPELVIDEYNGLLISPTADALKTAVERLLKDTTLRHRLQSNARKVAPSYDISIWRKRWRNTLQACLPERHVDESGTDVQWNLVHLCAGGVVWDAMRQRPQQMFQAFAEVGQMAHFVCDEARDESFEINGRLRLLGRNATINVERPVLYIYYTYHYQQIRNFQDPIVIYDVLDDPVLHAESDRKVGMPADGDFLHYHNRLLEEADIVLTSSRRLLERYRPQRPDMVLVPNGVHPEHFQYKFALRPADMPSGGPVIGYYGAISDWFDFELIEKLARQRPDHQVVLIGVNTRLPETEALCKRCPNVHFLGQKLYSDLPGYLAHFDAAIIPFIVNEITNAVSPVKFFEYMAGGKPVVTTAFEEIRQYDEALIAHSHEEFIAKIDVAMGLRKDPAFQEAARRLVSENTWRQRAERVVAELDRRFGPGASAQLELAASAG